MFYAGYMCFVQSKYQRKGDGEREGWRDGERDGGRDGGRAMRNEGITAMIKLYA